MRVNTLLGFFHKYDYTNKQSDQTHPLRNQNCLPYESGHSANKTSLLVAVSCGGNEQFFEYNNLYESSDNNSQDEFLIFELLKFHSLLSRRSVFQAERMMHSIKLNNSNHIALDFTNLAHRTVS